MALARGDDGAGAIPGAHHGKRLVAAPSVNAKVVNGTAPDLFPVMSLVKS
jgi:hypothetical protein